MNGKGLNQQHKAALVKRLAEAVTEARANPDKPYLREHVKTFYEMAMAARCSINKISAVMA